MTCEQPADKIKAYYDGHCPMCSAIMESVRDSAKGGEFDLRDMHKEKRLPFARQALEKEMHVVDRDGRTHKGAEAIFKIAEQYPHLRILLVLARTPLIKGAAPIVYRFVAANRRFLFGAASRLFWLKASVIMAFCVGLAMSSRLWIGPRSYPPAPIVSALPQVEDLPAYCLFSALFLLAAAILVVAKPQRFIAAFLAIIGAFCLLDQTRWQPWVIGRLTKEIDGARSLCASVAGRLSAKRHDVARKVDAAVVEELGKLGVAHARFTTRIVQTELSGEAGGADFVNAGRKKFRLNSRGYDDVEFLISTNLGEEEMPLVRVASGGEVSRIMLALKSILAKSDRLPVLIFDEIDVGVSGRVAQAVGRSLKNLSNFHQIIAITHLPQIAGLADAHFAVEKKVRGTRTTTGMRRLSLDEQVHEVARLLSGAEVTDAGLVGARELMGLPRPT